MPGQIKLNVIIEMKTDPIQSNKRPGWDILLQE